MKTICLTILFLFAPLVVYDGNKGICAEGGSKTTATPAVSAPVKPLEDASRTTATVKPPEDVSSKALEIVTEWYAGPPCVTPATEVQNFRIGADKIPPAYFKLRSVWGSEASDVTIRKLELTDTDKANRVQESWQFWVSFAKRGRPDDTWGDRIARVHVYRQNKELKGEIIDGPYESPKGLTQIIP